MTSAVRGAPPAATRAAWGALPDGRRIELLTLRAGTVHLSACTYGGIIVALHVPDRHGRLDDVVLGHDDLRGYVEHSPYFGAIVGRVANRIAHGRLTVDGTRYQLSRNEGDHHLHGGAVGFDRAVWEAELSTTDDCARAVLTHVSPDGDQGYPGTLHATVTYTLGAAADLMVEYSATADRTTAVNLTQHSYFNLAGARSGADVLEHELRIHAEHYTPVDASRLPTGDLAPVADTPFDFRSRRRIGALIDADHPQLRVAGGYDHNFVLAPTSTRSLAHAVHLAEPVGGRTLDIFTTEPGLQFYSGNFLNGTIRGKSGGVYGHRSGLCLETQHFPDAPHHAHFPSVLLRPGEEYRTRTLFRFGVLSR